MIYLGTSGYSYDDWIGKFYSENINKGKMLEEYSRIFKFTEINSTYYTIPNRFMFFHIVEKVPDEFKFSVKLHSSMTHTRDAEEVTYKAFNDALSPLIENEKLGCLVAQFPYSFHKTALNMDYIKRMKERFGSLPLCAEFRNEEWMNADVYKVLANEEIGFVCVDEPDIKGLVRSASIVTSKVGYIRFHGRNSTKWYNHKESYERYDYLYNEDELKEWVPKVKFVENNTDVTFIAFNNHFRGQAAVNANMLQRLLNENI